MLTSERDPNGDARARTRILAQPDSRRPVRHDIHPGVEVPVAVWEVLSTIPDTRSRQGRRHDLATVDVIALAAVLAGQRTLAAIAEWAADLPAWRSRPGSSGPAQPKSSTFAGSESSTAANTSRSSVRSARYP